MDAHMTDIERAEMTTPEVASTPAEVVTVPAGGVNANATVTIGGKVKVGPTNGVGTAAGVLGIVGMALILIPFVGGILCFLAMCLGGIGISKGEPYPRGMAITGLVLGIIGVAIYAVFTFFIVGSAALGA